MSGYAGGTAATDIARLRRMINDTSGTAYSYAALVSIIAQYPVPDVAGEKPLLYSGSANTEWVATYDLAMAAADVWDEKAAALATTAYDFTADGATFNRSQAVKGATQQAGVWRSRRMAVGQVLRSDLGRESDVYRWISNYREQNDE
jgi:hypothetical protein